MWKSPFIRQCFVSTGVTLNFGNLSVMTGFTVGFLEQLRRPGSQIQIDDSPGSWIVSVPWLSIVLGNFVAPVIMSRYGRKIVNLCGVIFFIIAWVCMFFAYYITTIVVSRFLLGFGLGFIYATGPLLVGEYTSPKYRGAFLMTLSSSTAILNLLTHQMLLYVEWRISSVICGVYCIITMVVIALSPESPSWLISKERYEEGRTVFRWLRGELEDEELEKMIDANIELVKTRESFGNHSIMRQIFNKIKYFKTILVKKEFYKPLLIMIHIDIVANWTGAHLFTSNVDEAFQFLDLEDSINIPVLILISDITRTLTSFLATYLIKKMPRRKLYFSSVGFNILMLLLTASYAFARKTCILPIDHPSIGIILNYIIVFSMVVGHVPLCYAISGEIFPLEFKSMAGALNMAFFSVLAFGALKSFPYTKTYFGVEGTYCLYSVIAVYCALVTWFTLPETKDRTLQDIEDQFRGRSTLQGQVQSLTS